MARTSTVIDASPEQVYAVLADGWNYADWVVGAVHIRAVDDAWPAPGSRVHHPGRGLALTITDSTEVVACDPAGSMNLRARMWPLGEARGAAGLTPRRSTSD